MSDSTDSSLPSDTARPMVARRFRLQWEAAQSAHVLLYPEGMIQLNGSAGEILQRCNGESTIADITTDLENAFATSGLMKDVKAFVALAVEKTWVVIRE
jgi:pyrroloquinoline quinone biosynthesis protein D